VKKWIVFLIISIVILLFSLAPTHLLPPWGYIEGSFSVSPTTPKIVSHYMTFGSQVKGHFDISGGNDDLYFYILDSGGNRVFDAGTVYTGYVLYWEASKNDYFRFVFDNSMSLFTTKDVSITLNFYYYTIFLYVLGFVNLGIAVILLIKDEILPRYRTTKEPIPVSMKKCPQCGMEFSPEDEYCPKCGAKLESV